MPKTVKPSSGGKEVNGINSEEYNGILIRSVENSIKSRVIDLDTSFHVVLCPDLVMKLEKEKMIHDFCSSALPMNYPVIGLSQRALQSVKCPFGLMISLF